MTETLKPEPWTPTRTSKTRVFHYTSAAGLLGVLTKHELWATEAAGLNDKAEITTGWRVVNEWLAAEPDTDETDELRLSIDVHAFFRDVTSPTSAYVLCASEEGDDANQWRLYGDNGRGYAIELDSAVQLAVRSDEEPHTDPGVVGRSIRFDALEDQGTVTPWSKVMYRRRHITEALDSLKGWAPGRLERARSAAPYVPDDWSAYQENEALAYADIGAGIAALAHSYKARGFAGEHESRVIATFALGDRHASFRASQYGLVRYVRLTAAGAGGSGAVHFNGAEGGPLPIKSVRMGPAIDKRTGKAAVRSLLKRCGYGDLPVTASKVKLR